MYMVRSSTTFCGNTLIEVEAGRASVALDLGVGLSSDGEFIGRDAAKSNVSLFGLFMVSFLKRLLRGHQLTCRYQSGSWRE